MTENIIKQPKILNKKGYGLLKTNFKDFELQKARRECTVVPFVVSDYNKPEPFEIYRESKKYLYLPKFYGLSRYGPPDKINIDDGESVNIKFNGKIRENQETPCMEAKAQLNSCGGGVLCLPCGFGKTVLAINLICWLGKKALVIVNKEFLLNQWKERIEQFCDAKVGIIQQNKVDVEGKDIVLGMLHSVAMKDYDPSIFSKFGTVVVDEVHHIAARVFSNALPKIASKFMIGLSATPNRKDGLSKVFEWFIGDVFLQIKRKSHTVLINKITLNLKDEEYSKEVTNFRNKVNLPKMITNLTEYNERNKVIVKVIKHLVKNQRHILLLSDRREHLALIENYISKNEVCSVGYYVGGMKAQSLKESEEKQLILGTFMMAAEAMDIPDLDTLILASPKGDIEQAVGRILRKIKDNISPLVVDIVDPFSSFFNQSIRRTRFYKKHNYKIYNSYHSEDKKIDVNSLVLDTKTNENEEKDSLPKLLKNEKELPKNKCLLD